MVDVEKVVNWFRVRNRADERLDESIDELTQMKVMKLLYYVQGTSLAVLNRRLFSQDIVAWKYGPAVVEVHDKYKGKKGIVGNITEKDLEDYNLLTKDKNTGPILEAVYEAFGNTSAYDLMKQTHKESPWKETEQSSVITDKSLKKFFSKIVIK